MMNANGTGILYVDFVSNDDGTEITTQENFNLVLQAIINGAYAVARIAAAGLLFLPLTGCGTFVYPGTGEQGTAIHFAGGDYTLEFTATGATLTVNEE